MHDLIELRARRNRGWPWPEQSWGLTPMFGADGWCHSCGVPRHAQSGFLVLQRKAFKPEGAWTPNWQFDAICLANELADSIAGRFGLVLREVRFPDGADAGAKQLVIPSTTRAWFRAEELTKKAIEVHGIAGKTCPDCGVWRWMPLGFDNLPRIDGLDDLLSRSEAVAASPEWFGDGWKAYRQIVVRRELGELIAKASPRDYKLHELS